jgi:hypothetical protein
MPKKEKTKTSRHPDEAEDKALIKRVVLPSALKESKPSRRG